MLKSFRLAPLPRTIARGFSSIPRRLDAGKLTGASQDETAHFNALASSWWDVNGPQRILHKMNLLRMDYINEILKSRVKLNEDIESPEDEVYIPPYNLDLLPEGVRQQIVQEQDDRRNEILSSKEIKALDVGCGGGILSESLARLSFIHSVKGIDMSPDVLEAARIHKEKDPLLEDTLEYELTAVEDLPKDEKYDIITVFEVLEHVQYPSQMLSEIFDRLETGGWVFLSTINRDPVSWFTTIFMGEHLLRIVPVGTHTLEKYINEGEIREWLQTSEYSSDFKVEDSRGCIYLPAYGWKFTSNAGVGNYFMAIQKVR